MARIAQAIRKGIGTRKFPYSKNPASAYHWTYVLRAKDKRKRGKIADGIERAVRKNKLIKYSNTKERNARLFDEVKDLKFDCLKLKHKATTNCCNLASVACRFAGLKTPRKSSSRTLPMKWKDLGFKVYKYKHGKTKLRRGDILVSTTEPKPHTAVYIG